MTSHLWVVLLTMPSKNNGCCFLFCLGFFSSSFCIYRSTPHLALIYYCLLTVVDQGDSAEMCFIDVLKVLRYVGYRKKLAKYPEHLRPTAAFEL